MREGSLEAPTRHPIDWNNPDFYDSELLDKELRHAFDICHGCRRCFNLCDSFPRLFDLIDESKSGELDTVESKDFKPVVDACTLCDMCFMSKCPYVPPHEFDLDFPHLMLRYRAIEHSKGLHKFSETQLTKTDRNGKMAGLVAPIANWATDSDNKTTRPLMEKVVGIHKKAALPKFHGKTFMKQAKTNTPIVNHQAPAHGRKAIIYATCSANYNNPEIGMAALGVLAKNGIAAEVVYPECCGMPQMEQGDLANVAQKAANIASALKSYVDDGYDVISLVPSCTLMLKFEWPLLVPENSDVIALSKASFDISEYIVDIARNEGVAEGMAALDGGVSVHIACHARAQNMGQKASDMMKLVPDINLKVVERCSGHGGSWGIQKDNFDVAIKVGRPAFRQMKNNGDAKYIASECPLASLHIGQGLEMDAGEGDILPETVPHPIILIARAYGIDI